MPPKRGSVAKAGLRHSRRLNPTNTSSPLRSLSTERASAAARRPSRRTRRNPTPSPPVSPPPPAATSSLYIGEQDFVLDGAAVPARNDHTHERAVARLMAEDAHYISKEKLGSLLREAYASTGFREWCREQDRARERKQEEEERYAVLETDFTTAANVLAARVAERAAAETLDQADSEPFTGSPVSKRRAAPTEGEAQEGSGERAHKIPRPSPAFTSTSTTLAPLDPTTRAVQSARPLRRTRHLDESELDLSYNITDPNTEFGRHHSERMESKLRKMRAALRKHETADSTAGGPEDDNDYLMSGGLQPAQFDPRSPVAPAYSPLTPAAATVPETPTGGGWGLGSVLSKVTTAISLGYWRPATPYPSSQVGATTAPEQQVARIPQSEPHITHAASIDIAGDGQHESPAPYSRSQAQVPPRPITDTPSRLAIDEVADDADDEHMPATPTPSAGHGITTESFEPKTISKASTTRRTRPLDRYHRMQERKRQAAAEEAAERKMKYDASLAQADKLDAIKKKLMMTYPFNMAEMQQCKANRAQGHESGIKRKFRVDDFKVLPRSKDGNYYVLDYFEEESDGEDYCYLDDFGFLSKLGPYDVVNKEPLLRRSKKGRFTLDLEDGITPSQPTWSTGPFGNSQTGSLDDVTSILTPGVKAKTTKSLTSGDPHHAQPYLGRIFAPSFEELERERRAAENVFGAADSQPEMRTASQQKSSHEPHTGPKTGPGVSAVPDESQGDETSTGAKTATQSMIPNSDPFIYTFSYESDSDEDSTEVEEAKQSTTPETSASEQAAAAKEVSTSGSNAAGVLGPSQASSEALERARKRALQHAPKKGSGLREFSRLSSSPSVVYLKADAIAAPRDAAATDSTPYEQTLQYAIDLANQIDVDDLPASTFVFPPAKPAPWAHLVEPEINAPLEKWFAQPEADEECNTVWAQHFATYQNEKAAGMHGPVATAVTI